MGLSIKPIARPPTLRAGGIYLGYKNMQFRDWFHRSVLKTPSAEIESIWERHHSWAGSEMYSLAVDLRGFYLKTGQFVGARGDFVPMAVCERLTRLHDQVPPMPPALARAEIERALGSHVAVEDVFEWLELEQPLGSASISQVHRGKLRKEYRVIRDEGHASTRAQQQPLRGGEDASPSEKDLHPGRKPKTVRSAEAALVSADPEASRTPQPFVDSKHGGQIVAVKIQYPNALRLMELDLSNIRLFAAFLSKTEIKFDLVSAVDELATQIRLEFNFRREASIMDQIADHLAPLKGKVVVPRSVPGLVSDRLLVMEFLEGVPMTKLGERMNDLPEKLKRLAAERILTRVAEAYGRMILIEGLFQADCHPGNILVKKGGVVGLLDYGQSKLLTVQQRRSFAALIEALNHGNDQRILGAVKDLGIVLERDDAAIVKEMAYGMFDTRGHVDPFDPESPIKKLGIQTFPKDLFFILRTVQLLRGLKEGMKLPDDFSTAALWRSLANETLKKAAVEAAEVQAADAAQRGAAAAKRSRNKGGRRGLPEYRLPEI